MLKRYEKDPYEREFTAAVTGCVQEGDTFRVTLTETAFYPEGGGQPADHGTLGGAQVLDVREKDGEIYHVVNAPLPVGETVTGVIDWERRFDHMQQHSGEHIVSGMICRRFSCDNVGFHMGADMVTIDFNTAIPPEALPEIEAAANQYLWENHGVEIVSLSGEALEKAVYRSKKFIPGAVRLVEFPGADRCACCGTHVKFSGEIGMIKLLSCQTFRSGVRIEMLCGKRAYDYCTRIVEQNREVSRLLSAKPLATAAAVERLTKEIFTLKGRVMALEEESFAQKALAYVDKGDCILIEEGLSPDSVRKLCDAVFHNCGGLCGILSKTEGGALYAIADKTRDLRPLAKALNEAFAGRGGGKPGFVQGSLSRFDEKAVSAMIESFGGEAQ